MRIDDKCIRLPKIGLVKFKKHRQLPPAAIIKTVTITRNAAAKYYVSMIVSYENQVVTQKPHNIVALAFSQNGIYTDSNGLFEGYPVKFKQKNKRLLLLQKAAATLSKRF